MNLLLKLLSCWSFIGIIFNDDRAVSIEDFGAQCSPEKQLSPESLLRLASIEIKALESEAKSLKLSVNRILCKANSTLNSSASYPTRFSSFSSTKLLQNPKPFWLFYSKFLPTEQAKSLYAELITCSEDYHALHQKLAIIKLRNQQLRQLYRVDPLTKKSYIDTSTVLQRVSPTFKIELELAWQHLQDTAKKLVDKYDPLKGLYLIAQNQELNFNIDEKPKLKDLKELLQDHFFEYKHRLARSETLHQVKPSEPKRGPSHVNVFEVVMRLCKEELEFFYEGFKSFHLVLPLELRLEPGDAVTTWLRREHKTSLFVTNPVDLYGQLIYDSHPFFLPGYARSQKSALYFSHAYLPRLNQLALEVNTVIGLIQKNLDANKVSDSWLMGLMEHARKYDEHIRDIFFYSHAISHMLNEYFGANPMVLPRDYSIYNIPFKAQDYNLFIDSYCMPNEHFSSVSALKVYEAIDTLRSDPIHVLKNTPTLLIQAARYSVTSVRDLARVLTPSKKAFFLISHPIQIPSYLIRKITSIKGSLQNYSCVWAKIFYESWKETNRTSSYELFLRISPEYSNVLPRKFIPMTIKSMHDCTGSILRSMNQAYDGNFTEHFQLMKHVSFITTSLAFGGSLFAAAKHINYSVFVGILSLIFVYSVVIERLGIYRLVKEALFPDMVVAPTKEQKNPRSINQAGIITCLVLAGILLIACCSIFSSSV